MELPYSFSAKVTYPEVQVISIKSWYEDPS